MKKIFVCVALVLLIQNAFAQRDSLQIDENNNYVYYKVVAKSDAPADTVYQRAWNFAKDLSKTTPIKGQAEKAFNAKGKFVLYSGSSIVRKESGEVGYTFNFQAADGKYRYKFSNFVFTPYKRDRYGNMTAVPGMDTPLEKLTEKYSKKELEEYLNQIAVQCIATESGLKQAVERVRPAKKDVIPKKVNTGDW